MSILPETHCEFFWPNGERPGYAIRWSVEPYQATAEVTEATTSFYSDGRSEDVVLSDGGADEDFPLDGAWKPHFQGGDAHRGLL
jgi:hypothetical protein